MSITIDKNLLGVWFVPVGPAPAVLGDILQGLSRTDTGFELTLRLRTYDPADPDNDPWSDQDRKRWLGGPVKAETAEEAIEKARGKFREAAEVVGPGHEVQELLVGVSGVEEFTDRLLAQPWANFKRLDEDGRELRAN